MFLYLSRYSSAFRETRVRTPLIYFDKMTRLIAIFCQRVALRFGNLGFGTPHLTWQLSEEENALMTCGSEPVSQGWCLFQCNVRNSFCVPDFFPLITQY
jgi:hypothetical protein